MKYLTQHLKDAIAINKERMPLYGKLSNGETLPFSKKLIQYEKYGLKGAWFFDRVGKRFQKQGVPFLELEFVDMALTPKFSQTYPEEIDYTRPIEPIEMRSFSKTLHYQLRDNDFEGLVESCNVLLEDLEEQSHVYCMLRHLIESIRWIAHLAPINEAKCQVLNIDPPTPYVRFLINSHLFLLPESMKFDEQIAPIQNKGIPFVFQDLPTIALEVA